MAANAYLIGTLIIISGFIIMIIQAIVEPPVEQVLIAFFYTLSGLIFWGIAARLNPDKEFAAEMVDEFKQLMPEKSLEDRMELEKDEEEKGIEEEKEKEKEEEIYDEIFAP